MVDFSKGKVNSYLNKFNGFTDFIRRIDFWLRGILGLGLGGSGIMAWNTWVGATLLSLSALMCCSGIYSYFAHPFISLKEAAGIIYERLRTADFLPTLDRTSYSVYHLLDEVKQGKIELYGEKSPSTLKEKIPVSIISQRCLDREEFDRFCFTDGGVDYQALSVKRSEFRRWLKTQEPYHPDHYLE